MASIQDLTNNALTINAITADIKRIGKCAETLRDCDCHESASSVERDLVRLMKRVGVLAQASLNPPTEACDGHGKSAFGQLTCEVCPDPYPADYGQTLSGESIQDTLNTCAAPDCEAVTGPTVAYCAFHASRSVFASDPLEAVKSGAISYPCQQCLGANGGLYPCPSCNGR